MKRKVKKQRMQILINTMLNDKIKKKSIYKKNLKRTEFNLV